MKINLRSQITLGQWMALVAFLAVLMTLPRLKTAAEIRAALGCLALLLSLALTLLLTDSMLGMPCPGCGRWALHPLARHRVYHRCSACGGRFKRLRSLFLTGPWLDASGPEDDAYYRGRVPRRGKTKLRGWLTFTVPRDHADSTTGRLLGSQRRRKTAAPEPRGPTPPA
jgi:hypothetical protein